MWYPSGGEIERCLKLEMKIHPTQLGTVVEARFAGSAGNENADKGGLPGNDKGGLSGNDKGGLSGSDNGGLSGSDKGGLCGVKDDKQSDGDSKDRGDDVHQEYKFVGRGFSKSIKAAQQLARERVYECTVLPPGALHLI